ncbi:MAG TPA: hypothetical protein VHE30_07185 [Polyangiaceae bacterium]|nr:hypothetical protein [Polyangiaceae bacterium]
MRFSGIVLVALTSCVACVDPSADFAAFEGRTHVTPIVDASSDAPGCTVPPDSINAKYLLAISVTLAAGTPILVLANVTTPELGSGTGLSLDAQPLAAADRKTPVGDAIEAGPFPVSAEGSFTADLVGLRVTGAANPVTGGDILADVSLNGNLCGDPRSFCGTVTGYVKEPLPLDLAGSTFTLTRVEPSEDPPLRPPIDCAGTLADPL